MEHHHESLLADPRFWVGVAFVIFFVIFGRKLWSTLAATLDNRGRQIAAELEEAARLRREAEALLEEARASRTAALQQAEAMMTQAKDEAGRIAEVARAEAATAARRREKLATDRIAAAEKAALNEVRNVAVDVASRAARHVLSSSFDAAADTPLVDHAIQGLPAALSGRRAA